MSIFRSLAIVVVVALVTLCALFSLSAHSAADAAVKPMPQADAGPMPSPADPSGEAEGAIDLFGNDVSDAVARYRLDATGSLYEVHSPQTEIPKLGSPKS